MNFAIFADDIEVLRLCPVCNSNRHIPISELYCADLNIFTTSCCKNCCFVFRSLRPRASWFKNNWIEREKTITEADYSFNSTLEQRRYKRYKNLAVFFEKISDKKKILDIGTGPGTGLRAFKDRGWEAIGFEPDPARAKIAVQQHGIRIIDGQLDELQERFDFVALIHTLEHMHSLNDFLNGVVKCVKPGGYIYIEVPDLFHFVNWRDALYLEHMGNFSIENLIFLGSRLGLSSEYQLFPKTQPFGKTHIGVLFKKEKHAETGSLAMTNLSERIKFLYTKGLPKKEISFPIRYHLTEINNLAAATDKDYPVFDKKNNCFIMSHANLFVRIKMAALKLIALDDLRQFIANRLLSYTSRILPIFKDDDFENIKFIKREA